MNRRTAIIFYVISTYVLVQFIWWGYHLIELTAEVKATDAHVSKRIIMIMGEGSVFLLLLLIGIWQIQRSIKKELKLTQRQNNFLLSVTHELKTPLAANKLYLQTITKRDLNKEQTQQLINKAIDENGRLERMIDNILNASKLENKALQPIKEEIDLYVLASQIQSKFNTITDSEIIQLDLAPGVTFSGDRFMIESILNNLVENALKYSGKDHPITIYGSKTDSQIIFGVKDQGPGVKKEHIQNIFDKFYRSENEEIRTQKGSGLGLFIVKSLVEIHNGKIQYQENQPQGADFKIEIKNG